RDHRRDRGARPGDRDPAHARAPGALRDTNPGRAGCHAARTCPCTADSGASGVVTSDTRLVAEYLAGVAATPLPDDVAARTRLHLLDALAAMISGSTLDAGRRARAYVRQEGVSQDASIIGGEMTATAADAAFANGMSGHADETDDSHPAGFHPGC